MSAENYSIQQEEAALSAEITLNHGRLMESPQGRHPVDHRRAALRGQLIDPNALMFEQRMNNELEKYYDLTRFAAQAVLLEAPKAA